MPYRFLPSASSAAVARCAASFAAWWVAVLLTGLWGWGMDGLTPQAALGSCARTVATVKTDVSRAQACRCAMCGGKSGDGKKCCCTIGAPPATPLARAALRARCDDGDTTPQASPLASGTWHMPAWYGSAPFPAHPCFAARKRGALPTAALLASGRTPAPLSPPPLFDFSFA